MVSTRPGPVRQWLPKAKLPQDVSTYQYLTAPIGADCAAGWLASCKPPASCLPVCMQQFACEIDFVMRAP